MSHQSILNNTYGEITQYQKVDGIDIIDVKHNLCSASISLYGGQVLTWQLKGQPPIFWLSDTSSYQLGKAIRGGIPLCWPWFGSYKEGGNHGFARQMKWQLLDAKITEQEVIITLVTSGENLSPLWPTPFKLQQTLTFSTQFKQQLIIDNLSDKTVQFTSALHSYFQVSSPLYTSVPGLNTLKFDDKNTLLKSQQDKLEDCVGPIDRIYHSHGHNTQQIKDSGWQRIIEVESSHCQQWVLWNPGEEVAKSMTDVHAGGESEYVCLEAANTQWQTIPANENVTIEQKVTVIPF